jgi:hypothetical protein
MLGNVNINIDYKNNYFNLLVLTINWEASSIDGTVPITYFTQDQMDQIKCWYANMAITIPGVTVPPTNLYSIEIIDEHGIDIYGTKLKFRSTTLKEQAIPQLLSGLLGPRQIYGAPLYFKLTGNTNPSATGICQIFFIK